MQAPPMDQPDFMDDALEHGVAIGDRDDLWRLVQAAHCLRDEDAPWRPQREGVLSPGVSAAHCQFTLGCRERLLDVGFHNTAA